ncbi:nucleoside-diphosphate kinase [Natranaerofaba carboxydovora]|uniref:nucleoside-diphosphate kinase n=1 Tax=Natranaerofaba carboxydovora TaxID=2742683 RepID=UPI001F1380FD|nr:nucleoside-diphosphate kinase [Natranaerofaba carboxydovora]UMZ73584.1 Nucleoside diphosphate kinase [Natranaerofaba carboxydovora]
MEKTFVMIKPDGVQRNLAGNVISRLENKGLKLKGLKLMQISESLAKTHYGEHEGKPFFQSLIDYITSGPVIAMVWEGENAIEVTRNIMGETDPKKAAPGTIRGDLALTIGANIVHGSDSPESAEKEIGLFFSQDEIIDYNLTLESWVYQD